MRITGWKSIAAAIAKASGTTCVDRTARRYAAQKRDPLPVQYWNRVPGIEEGQLAAWAKRQWKAKRRKVAA